MRNFIIKRLMKSMEVFPKFDLENPLSENINHPSFKNASESKKKELLINMVQKHYLVHKKKSFASNFPKHEIGKYLKGKDVLDLGCWCGAMAVFCAEQWEVNSMSGIDVDEYFIDTARNFSDSRENKSIKYDFRHGFGESIPFEDNKFDAIISWDTFEHVKSVEESLKECKRVVKPGGLIFCVFPSYYEPGGAHLGFVTRMPLLQWFFDSESLNRAYGEILTYRGKEANWYSGNNQDWQKLKGGIGINGTTFSDYSRYAKEAGFSKTAILPTPLFSIGFSSAKEPKLKLVAKFLEPLVRTKLLRDFFSHRIVSIIKA